MSMTYQVMYPIGFTPRDNHVTPTPPVLPAAAVDVMGRSAPRTLNGIICAQSRQ